MKTTIFGLLIGAAVLAGCGSGVKGNKSGQRQLDAISAKMVAEELIKPRLREPSSAEFSNITFKQETATTSMIICGHVNSRNGLGGMTGPQRFITGGTVMVEEEVGRANMDTAWARFC